MIVFNKSTQQDKDFCFRKVKVIFIREKLDFKHNRHMTENKEPHPCVKTRHVQFLTNSFFSGEVRQIRSFGNIRINGNPFRIFEKIQKFIKTQK